LRLAEPSASPPRITGLRLLDYKTGDPKKLEQQVKAEVVERLLNAQLPIYLAAALAYLKRQEEQAGWRVDWEQIWGEAGTGSDAGAGAAYYALRDLPTKGRSGKTVLVACDEWPLPTREFFSEAGAAGSLRALIAGSLVRVRDGRFPVAPAECGTTSCPARFICRYRDLPSADDSGGKKGGEA